MKRAAHALDDNQIPHKKIKASEALQKFFYNRELPQDIKTEIKKHVELPEWWYLTKQFFHEDYYDTYEFIDLKSTGFTPRPENKENRFKIGLPEEERILNGDSIMKFYYARECNFFMDINLSSCFCLQMEQPTLSKTPNKRKSIFFKEVEIYAEYYDYTIPQLMMKNMLLSWLLIEKPNKKIINLQLLFENVAQKHEMHIAYFIYVWKTLPIFIRFDLWKNVIRYKIERYGKIS
jgi:hypothetical protein